ncbi:MAG: pyridoxal phosphate-dependent aminotransferase [Gemmataceae bacterium]
MAYPFAFKRLLARTGLSCFFPSLDRQADGAGPFLHYYADRVLAAPLDDLELAARFWEATAPDVIDLARAEPRVDLAASAGTRLPVDRRGTPPPWGSSELRRAVADWLFVDDHISVDPVEEVLITHGASGAFGAVADAFVNPGTRVVLFDPTSPLFPAMLRQRRARLRWVPTWVQDGRVRFRPESLAKALRGARLLVLADPVNPTGAVFSPEDLELIAWWASRHDVLVVQDDTFARYRYEGERRHLATFPVMSQRIIAIGSASKGYGLSPARVGWLAGHRHLVRPCALTQALTTPFVPTLCQQLALAALRRSEEAFTPIRVEFASRRQYVVERLQVLGLNPSRPAGGYFLWLPIYQFGIDGRTFAGRLLESKKVLVRPGELYGPGGIGFVRLSYAAEEGRLLEGLARLAEFLPGLQPPVARLVPEEAPADEPVWKG